TQAAQRHGRGAPEAARTPEAHAAVALDHGAEIDHLALALAELDHLYGVHRMAAFVRHRTRAHADREHLALGLRRDLGSRLGRGLRRRRDRCFETIREPDLRRYRRAFDLGGVEPKRERGRSRRLGETLPRVVDHDGVQDLAGRVDREFEDDLRIAYRVWRIRGFDEVEELGRPRPRRKFPRRFALRFGALVARFAAR